MNRLLIFSPLVLFAAFAVYHLTAAGSRPFLLRWIDLSAAFMISLAAAVIIKRLLLGSGDDEDDDGGNP